MTFQISQHRTLSVLEIVGQVRAVESFDRTTKVLTQRVLTQQHSARQLDVERERIDVVAASDTEEEVKHVP
jgi:hypothetical protein